MINLHYAFADQENIYLVTDLAIGGDLRHHVYNRGRFNQSESKFFISCILLGLQYMHKNGVIHRDIKPENLVIDEDGYVRIIDVSLSTVWTIENCHDTSGTPGYMAPEVICGQNHGFVVDYFALGVIAFEFMLGARPYDGKSR